MSNLLSNSVIHGAFVGALAAASVDLSAFRSWKNFHDVAVYNWSTASFRWLQGAVIGALASSGFSLS